MKSISVIIPAYNEERRLEATLKKILAYLEQKNLPYEIIVVDDGSKDATVKVVESQKNKKVIILQNGVNRGKGFSVKSGMLAAKKEWLLMSDADLSTPIEELEKFSRYLDFDALIASRALPESKLAVRQPWYRELGGRLINLCVQLMALPGIKDTQCGFKLFRREAALKIFPRQTIDRWGFDIEILYIAKKLGFKIKELPVAWSNSPQSKVRPFRDGFRILGDLIKIKLNDWRGIYKR